MNLYFIINREQLESGIQLQQKLLSELDTKEKGSWLKEFTSSQSLYSWKLWTQSSYLI